MTQFATHIPKTLALLAILLLPVQRSLATACCCHRGANLPASADSTSRCCSHGGAGCCCQQDRGPSCCQASDSEAGSSSGHGPCGCSETASPEVIAFSADTSFEVDDFVGMTPSVSVISCQKGMRCSGTCADVFCKAIGTELCIQLCRYQL